MNRIGFKRRLRQLTRRKAVQEEGLTLVSVLWGLAILSLIVVAMLASGRLSYRMERNSWKAVEGQTLADAGIAQAILAISDQRADRRWRVDGVPRSFSFDGAEITIRIQDELGKIDLNAGSEDLLRNLFRSAVGDPAMADGLTDKVLDWRSPNTNLHRLNGAEPEDYKARGYLYHPRNGPFQSVDELRLVMGMTPEIFKRIEPAVTVYSTRPTVDPDIAPEDVLRAMPGMDDRRIKDVLAARGLHGNGLDVQGNALPRGIVDPRISLTGRAFSIRSDVRYGGREFHRDATVRFTGDPARPYMTLAWK